MFLVRLETEYTSGKKDNSRKSVCHLESFITAEVLYSKIGMKFMSPAHQNKIIPFPLSPSWVSKKGLQTPSHLSDDLVL
jgi:hypothetical protein